MDLFNRMSDTLGSTLVDMLFSASSRLFLPFLISSLIIAVFAMWWERKVTLRPDQRLISGATWGSRSALNDYGLVLLNALILSFAIAPFMPDAGDWAVDLARVFPSQVTQSPWWLPIALAFTLFVVDDFIRFIAHYLEHRIPALWELHKVHHSAEVLNFLTAERHHPLSVVFFNLLSLVGVVGVNAVFLALFHGQVSALSLLGGNAFWVATNFLGGALRHSPVWISFGPTVEKWLISPAQHQIHHSSDECHFDRNFGGTLAIWDRLFGTLYTTTAEREHISYGLGAETAGYLSLTSLYLRPIRSILAQAGIGRTKATAC